MLLIADGAGRLWQRASIAGGGISACGSSWRTLLLNGSIAAAPPPAADNPGSRGIDGDGGRRPSVLSDAGAFRIPPPRSARAAINNALLRSIFAPPPFA